MNIGLRSKLAQLVLLSIAALAPMTAWAQVEPAAVGPVPGFALPTLGGSLVYALNASESVSTGFYTEGSPAVSTNISGDLAYVSESQTHPFSMVYSGAVLAGDENQPTSVVQNLALSQVYETREGSFTVTDSVSYLPLSATTGLSGVPGLGDQGTDPPQTGPITGQGALTGYAPRVGNASTLSATRRLTGRTSLESSGSFVLQRFTGDDAGLIDSNQAVGSAGGSHVLDARSSMNANYTLSKITYSPDTTSSAFTVQGLNFGYSRQLSRTFSLDSTVGPEWIKTAIGGSPHTGLDLATDIALRAKTRMTAASASYVRGTNNGFGVIPGGFSNSFNSSVRRTFFRTWNGSATLNYTRTSNPAGLGLPSFSVDTTVAGVQCSRPVSRTLSTFVSYNAQHQSVGGAAEASAAFRGLYQVVSFGVTYAPRTISFGAR